MSRWLFREEIPQIESVLLRSTNLVGSPIRPFAVSSTVVLTRNAFLREIEDRGVKYKGLCHSVFHN